MATSSTLQISIEVDDNGSVRLRQFGESAANAGRTATSSLESMNSSMMKIIGTIGSMMAAFKLADITKDIAMAAARYETLGVVMEVVGRNASYTSTEMNAFALALQKTGISMTESRSNLTKMAQAQLDLTKSSELARIAQDAAVIGNMNSSDAFAHMIYGIQSSHVEVLRTIGINVNFENSYKTLASQLGKTTKELTETEKAGARMGAVLAAGPAIAGAYEAAMDTAGKQILSLKRYLDDFEVKMGEAFGPATKTLVEAATTALKEMQEQIVRPEVQKALQDLSSSLAQTLVSLGQDIPGKILGIAGALQTVSDIYRSLPADIVGAAGAGIIGAMLFGAGAGVVIAAITLTSAKISEFKKANPEIFGNAAEQSPQPLKVNISKNVDADALVLETRALKQKQAAFESLNSAIAKADANALLSSSNDPNVLKKKHLDELTASLRNNAIYQAYETANGKDAAEQWVKDSIALDKKTNSTTKAASEAKKYDTVMSELDAKIQAVEASGKEETAIAKLDKEFAKMAQTLGDTNPKLLYYYQIASQKIETEQIERYNKALADLATRYAEATRSKEDFAQYKIDEQYLKDVDAAIKAGVATKEYMDALCLLTDALKKNADAEKAKEDAKKSEQTALERSQALASMYQSMGDSSSKYYAGEIILLDIQAARYKKLMEDEKLSKEDSIKFQTALDEWYANQKQKSDDKETLQNGTFFDGLGVAYRKSQEDLLTWGKAGEKVFQALQKAGTTALSDGLFKTLKGEMNGFEDAWKSFCDTLLKTFTDMVAQMMMQKFFQFVLGTGGSSTINILGLGGSAGSSGSGAVDGLFSLAGLASLGKFLYNLPADLMALPAKIAALPQTLTNAVNVFTSMFSGTAGPGADMADIAAEITKQLAGEAVKVGAQAGAQAGVQAGVEIGAEMGVGAGANVGSLSMGAIGAIISIGAAIGDYMLKQTNGPTMEQMDALLRMEEAGQTTLTKENRDIYKGILLSQNFTLSLEGVNTTFAGTTDALNAWIASNQELLTMTMAEYDQLMGQQQKVWNEILTGDGTDATVYSPMGVGYHTESTGTITIALEMADEKLSLEKRMYNLGFVGTQNGWESSATLAMIAEFKDQGVPWKSINDALIAYGVTDADVYKRIYGEYTGTNMGNLSWEDLQTALYATGIDSVSIKRIESVYNSNIPWEDLMYLLGSSGLGEDMMLKIQAAVDPSQRWKDLIIPVDTSGIPAFIPIGGSNQDGRASGGPVAANTPYIVGEIGPELFVPQESGHILSNANMKKLMGMGVQGFADGTTDPFSQNPDDLPEPWKTIAKLMSASNSSQSPANTEASTPTQTLEEWGIAYAKELKKMLGLTNELGDALDTINDYYTEQTKTAIELGASSEQLAQMEIDHAAAKEKAIKDWMQTEIDYYNQMMGLNSELGDSLAEITKHYEDARKSANAATGSISTPEEATKAAESQSSAITSKRDADIAANTSSFNTAAELFFPNGGDELEVLRKQVEAANAAITASADKELAAIEADLQSKIKLAETTANTIAAIDAAEAAVKKKAIEDWYKSEVDYYNQMMGLNTELGDSLASIDEHYAAAIASAKSAGIDTKDLEQSAAAVKKKAIEDWYNSEVDYYNKMMGLNSELGDSLTAIDEHYAAAIASAKSAGASEEQLAALTQAATDVKKKAEGNYWKDAISYYNDMMGLSDPLQSSLDAANEKFNEYARNAEGNAEKLAAIEKARGDVLAKLLADWIKNLIKPFTELASSLTDWAKANRKSARDLLDETPMQDETKIQQASRHLSAQYEGLLPEKSASTITDYGKAKGYKGDVLTQYVTDLTAYLQTVTDALMAAYESLRSTRAAIDTDIADIANSMKTTDELQLARKAQWESSTSAEAIAAAKQTFLDSDAEQQAKLAEESHTYIMSYYQDEMAALKAKHEIEIANITAVRDKLKSLTYSSFNLSLPGTKQATSSQDYEKLYAAAKATGASSSAVSSYLSFADTYLQSSQDKYKSSESYQNIYKKVMAEIGALDTQPSKTIEELTASQTDEIKALNDDVTRVLNELGSLTDEGSKSIVNRLSTIITILEELGSYGDKPSTPASAIGMASTDFFKITAGMITPPVGFDPETGLYETTTGDDPLWAVVLADNNVSILEIMTYFYPLFYDQLKNFNKMNAASFQTISGITVPGKVDGKYTDPLWAAVLEDGNVSIVELLAFFLPQILNAMIIKEKSYVTIGTIGEFTDQQIWDEVIKDGSVSMVEIMTYFYPRFLSELTNFNKMSATDFKTLANYSDVPKITDGIALTHEQEVWNSVLADGNISIVEIMTYFYPLFYDQLKNFNKMNAASFQTISGITVPGKVDGKYTDPLWAAVLEDGNISIVELLTFFFPLFYDQLKNFNKMTPTDFTAISRTQFFKDDPLGKVILADGMISVGEIMAYFYPLFIQKLDNLINNTEILPFEVTNILDPTKTDEDKWKDIQKNNVTIPEIMLIYYGIFRKQLDKIIEGSGSGISLTDYFNVTSNPFSAFTSDSNGKEMATIAELLVFGFYAIIQFNDKLFSYILSIEKSLSDIAATVTSSSATATNSQIVGSISNGLIDVIAVLDETNVQTAFLSSWVYNQETKPANLMTNIEFNDKDDITAFLASWAYEQETKPVNLKTGIEFNQKDDITAYIASWAYGQQVIPVSASANLGFNLNDPTTALMYNWFFGGGIPTAYASIITTNTIINTVQTVYEEAPPPTPIIRNDYANLASFADGGISYGSLSGYPAMLHGTEAIIPLPNGRTLPVELKSTGNQSAQTDPEIKQLLRILVANQAQDKYLSVDGRQFKIFVQEQADVNRVNANRRAGNETRRIT